MATTIRVPMDEPLRRLELHDARPAADSKKATRVRWLMTLRDRQKREGEDSAALRAIVDSTLQAFQALPGQVNQRLDEVAGLAVELGLGVAREIVGAALDQGSVDVVPVVARSLRDCIRGAKDSEIEVHLHPEDLELAQTRLAAMPGLTEQLKATRFVPDPQVARGAARVETDAGRLRYDPRDALERVCAEVRREVAR